MQLHPSCLGTSQFLVEPSPCPHIFFPEAFRFESIQICSLCPPDPNHFCFFMLMCRTCLGIPWLCRLRSDKDLWSPHLSYINPFCFLPGSMYYSAFSTSSSLLCSCIARCCARISLASLSWSCRDEELVWNFELKGLK